MQEQIRTQAALVTGSSKGIGKAIALRLARENYYVYVTYYSDKEAGEKTLLEIQENGGAGYLLHLDVLSITSVRTAFEKVESDFGHLNVLVNNAVTDIAKNIEDASFEEWRIVTGTKIDGAFLCTKYALPLLKRGENANLIVITSYFGEKPDPELIAYCIGTAGLIAFTKAMALYLPKFGIRTNAVSPGATRTPLWDKVGGGEDEEMWKGFAKQNPMGRIPTVDDTAEATMLLINDPSRYLNGNFLYVNGGTHLL